MNQELFEQLFEARVEFCRDTLVLKAREYATDDRLHNFKVAAELQGMTPRQALGGMLCKHIVSIYDLIQKDEVAPQRVWDEKLGDAMNYLFLLDAVVYEELGKDVGEEVDFAAKALEAEIARAETIAYDATKRP